MSRIGKKPVVIPDGVKITQDGHTMTVTGPKGSLTRTFHEYMTIVVNDDSVVVTRSSDLGFHRGLHGLTRALIQNMVIGVTDGYVKKLEMIGVGYRGEMKGKNLVLNLGFSHQILVKPPDEITLEYVPKTNIITVSGISKELVGLTADRIRALRKPEPYKGKGIRYVGEHVRRKAGKTAA